jgi:DNA repair protein RecN (Recombination protein N)
LAELDARIDAVHSAARKHRTTPEELPTLRAQLVARLQEMQSLSDPALLAQRETEAGGAFRSAAGRLSKARAKVAAELAKAVTKSMQDLALAGGNFEIALPVVEGGASYGLENVEFLVAANPNQPPRPLAKVASGGELSRIGLAIQVITSRSASVPTLIFDEVDVGIGGGVAEVVGRQLRTLGHDRQVLCVTHLPQVAAQADWQWTIVKKQKGAETLSQVTQLDERGRIEEIARMLGGVKITDTTRRHAQEMLGLSPSDEGAGSLR